MCSVSSVELAASIGMTAEIGRRISIFSGISFVLLLAAGLGALEMANRAAEAERSIVHTMDVRRSARALLVQLLDAETGERGFVLTEEEKFLEPFNRAVVSVSPAVEQMSMLMSDDPEQQA